MNTTTTIQTPGLTENEWDQVHTQVQAVFDDLVRRIRSRCPSVVVRPGERTSGRVWFLFSDRSFNLTEDDTEAEDIVGGLTFSAADSGIRIEARIGGGETGITDYEAPERVVPANLAAVLAAARELAEELSRQEEVVIKAMSERRPPPDYRNGRV